MMMMMNNSFMTTSMVLLALVALLFVPAVVNAGEFIPTEFFGPDDDTATSSIEAASSDNDDNDNSNSTSSSSCASITAIVCHDDSNLKALCEAIGISELNDDLNEDTWTIFAPTDEAFEALGRNNLDSLVFGNDTVPLTDLLLFHVVPGLALTSDMLPCEAGNNLVEMANGETSRTICLKGDIFPSVQRGPSNNKTDPPMIIESDIVACNGVVHILDKVMLYQNLPFEIPDPVPQIPSEQNESEDVDVDIIEEDETTPIITTIAPTTVVAPTTVTVAPTVVGTIVLTTVETPAPTVPGSAVVTPVETTIIGEEVDIATPIEGDDEGDEDEVEGDEIEGEGDDEEHEEHEDEVEECQSIVEIACSNVAFSILCTLLEDNALVDDLSDGLWTVFAPTNTAFDNAPPFSADTDTDIEEVLLGHVIANAEIKFEDLVCTEKIEMTNGKNTRTVCQNGTTYQNGRGNDDERRPEIIDINIEACNGVVHVVNEVILP